MPGLWRNLLFNLLVLVFAGCASRAQIVRSYSPAVQQPKVLVVVLDGAGGYPSAYLAIRDMIQCLGLPIQVESIRWGHGDGRFIADETDVCYARQAGQQLAQEIQFLRGQYPSIPLIMVSHSAGAAPSLACAESLPPNTINRLILLAPAVSSTYDIRRALVGCKTGIDVFYSERDWFYLGIGMKILGTTDGKREVPAGRAGFSLPADCSPDTALFSKLRQYRWNSSMTWTGHTGGHTGTYRPLFLKTQIIPLIWSSTN